MAREQMHRILEAQRGIVATWQLEEAGVPRATAVKQVRQLRPLFHAVRLSGHAPPTAWQQARGATLTTRDSVLSGWPALRLAGLPGDWPTRMEVVRAGSSGRRHFGATGVGTALDVRYSTTLEGDRVWRDGVPMLTAQRAVRELLPSLIGEQRDRLIRDVLRLKLATDIELWAQVAKHRGARGAAILRALVDEYAPLKLGAERSDAEALARALLAAAGVDDFEINRRVAGNEADLVRREWWLILELDGPQFHQFLSRDARIQATWERAGWVVRRVPTGDVYDEPHRLLTAATTPVLPYEVRRAAATRTPEDVLSRWAERGRYEWSSTAPRSA